MAFKSIKARGAYNRAYEAAHKKPCPDCGKPIMRRSKLCKSCNTIRRHALRPDFNGVSKIAGANCKVGRPPRSFKPATNYKPKRGKCVCGLLLEDCDGHVWLDHDTPIEALRTNFQELRILESTRKYDI